MYGGLGAGGFSPGESMGFQVIGSNADTIQDLVGPFLNESLGGGAGLGASADTFQGTDLPKPVAGAGGTFGIASGKSGYVGPTWTLMFLWEIGFKPWQAMSKRGATKYGTTAGGGLGYDPEPDEPGKPRN